MKVFDLFILLLYLGNVKAALEGTTTESIADNGITVSLWNHRENDAFKQRINLTPFDRLNITVIDIPSDIWFIVLQIHTFQYNATLSYDKALLDKASNENLFGSNIGLYLKTHNASAPIRVFLEHDNVYNLDALLVIVTYGRNAPIPGGCNIEFDIEISPYQKLSIENGMIIVDTQPASILASNGLPVSCEESSMQYEMYRLYLPSQDFTPDTYFDAIARMLTTQDIVQNGDKIPANAITSSMRRIYSAYIGTGSVYAAIAIHKNYSSAYIPIFTYACSPVLYPESCQVLNDTFAKIICVIVLMIGCLSIIIGHKYACIEHLLLSIMIGGVSGYILAINIGDFSTAINLLIGMTLAAFTMIISVFLDICKLYKYLHNVSLGFLFACMSYLYAPAWLFYILEHNWLFWPMFTSYILVLATILTTNSPEILTRSIFGSYFVIAAIDYYVGSNLKYIIITIIRRITISEFNVAFVYPPFQSTDITLIVVWIFLVIIRFIAQCVSLYFENKLMTVYNAERVSLLSNYQ